MKKTWLQMGMPITLEIVDKNSSENDFLLVKSYFSYIDKTFSTYKKNSEISKINSGKLNKENYSSDMKKIFKIAEETKKITDGYFDIRKNSFLDPSGIVKGWAIYNASKILKKRGFKNFYIDIGGDIEVVGKNNSKKWKIGIRNPFNRGENIKILSLSNNGVATSGTSIRGQHIYNPHQPESTIKDVISLTVIGPNIYEADRFATAAFAMGKSGINFIEKFEGFEGYMIDSNGIATFTSNFGKFVD